MRSESRTHKLGRENGFTLIELLIVMFIIGLIAAMLIPMMFDSLQKSRQKRTMTDIRLIGVAWMSWTTDQLSAGAAGAHLGGDFNWLDLLTVDVPELDTRLIPVYAHFVPPRDQWGWEYEFRSAASLDSAVPVGIRSPGSDGLFDEVYIPGPFNTRDFDQDIVWAAGYFVRWPEGAGRMAAQQP